MRTLIFSLTTVALLVASAHAADRAKKVADETATKTTQLLKAVWHSDLPAVQQLIDQGAEVNSPNRYGMRPLGLACQDGDVKLVTLLLQAGADVNAKLPGETTPLMLAARTGRPSVVETLLKAGAEVNTQERSGQTALMWAAAEGNAQVVSLLIDAGADLNASLDSGFNPFLFAVREGRLETVRKLLDAGVDVNQAMRPKRPGGRMARKGTSPLVVAIENGHFELAAELLARGADPNDRRTGYTPLHILSWVRKPNRGDGLDGQPPPTGSGTVTSLQLVRNLVEQGAQVNARLGKETSFGRLENEGMTPFFLACDTADLPLMKLLVELGADPTLGNSNGTTPLMVAAGLGTHAPGEEAGVEAEMLLCVEYLLELGADINAVNSRGETAMHGAAYNNAPRMVKYLQQQGADVSIWNRKNKRGWTPLLIAEGFRPGNFKPSPPTVAAIRQAMVESGVTPPAPSVGRKKSNDAYK